MTSELGVAGSALGLSGPDTVAVLETAALAPSVHNTQPWAFRVAPDVIELHADPARRLPVADPDDQELRLACGAAVFNLRLALLARGVRPSVALYPDPARPQLVALIRRAGIGHATPELMRLLDAVPRRHTNRRPFTRAPVAAAERYALRPASAEEGAMLHPLPTAARAQPCRPATTRDALVGLALGGVLGLGTVLYALAIGPLTQRMLPANTPPSLPPPIGWVM